MENLVNKFSSIYRSMGDRENRPLDSSDVAVGVNHIRTILDEFVKSRYMWGKGREGRRRWWVEGEGEGGEREVDIW